MKQHITEEQFNELTETQKNDWYKFCRKNKYTFYDNGGNDFQIVDFPSIGEMIEFLTPSHVSLLYDGTVMDENLCDELWEAVKEAIKG